MGDDLHAAERFVASATVQMNMMLSAERQDMSIYEESLILIRDKAALLHAKGIARASENVLEAIQANADRPHIEGRLLSLNKLICQYADGLVEVTPVLDLTDEMIADDTAMNDIILGDDLIRLEQAHEQARQTLIPLISLAEDPKQANALRSLAGLSEPAVHQSGTSFESLMPDITDAIIAGARSKNKNLSVSYASGDIILQDDLVPLLTDFLIELGGALVTHSLETPLTREGRGEPASGHIGVTAEAGGEVLNLKIDCTGRPVSISRLDLQAAFALTMRGAEMSTDASETGVVIHVTNISLALTQPQLPGLLASEDLDLLQELQI